MHRVITDKCLSGLFQYFCNVYLNEAASRVTFHMCVMSFFKYQILKWSSDPRYFSRTHIYTYKALYQQHRLKRKKNVLYFSVNVFSTKVLIGDTIFTSPTGDGTAFLRGHPNHAKIASNLHGKGSTYVPQLF